ncbi:hypothetical protein V8E52_012056 [Russula decolorans]
MLNFISLKSEFYKESQIEALIFSYGFKNGKAENKYTIPFTGSYQSYGKSQLPISMDPLDFGKIVDKFTLEYNTVYIIHNDKGENITFIEFKDHNEIKISKSGNTLLSFKDVKSDSGFNGEQVLFTNEIKTNFISKIKISKNIVNNFITLDIETYIKDGLLSPYLICFYDEMIKYNYYKVYAHNMAKFDLIFLLKYLVKLGNIKPIIHNDDNQYNIEFKDNSLCRSFKIDEGKSIFPHLFVNENNLDYIGDVPKIENFIDLSKNDYKKYLKKFISNV